MAQRCAWLEKSSNTVAEKEPGEPFFASHFISEAAFFIIPLSFSNILSKRPKPHGEISSRWIDRLFVPVLAGATLRDRLVACFGALLGIGFTALFCRFLFGSDSHLPMIVAPMGASAVLVFAIPASPLAQPWPVIGATPSPL